MKKIAVFLALAMLAMFSSVAEPVIQEPMMLEGFVQDITEEGILMDAVDFGEVMVLINDETVIEATADISFGDYLYVDYNGQMTRSIPPQITAMVIRMYRLEGDIIEVYPEENAVMLQTIESGEVYVRLPEIWAEQEIIADHMTVYFNGAMTMSLPPQINAGFVVPGYAIQGAVTQINANSLLIGEGMSAIQVNFEDGMLPECLSVGAVIRVLHNGQMTRSIPAQVSAMEIVQLSR